MAETTIEWADYTFNPWIGCQRVSPGCEHCYAEAYDKRVGGAPKHLRARDAVPELRWGPKAARVRTSVALWKKPLKWNRDANPSEPRPRVFCASLADVFDTHESIEHSWRLELFSLIRQTPNLDWLLLTKRPENFEAVLFNAERVSARHNGYMGSDDDFAATRLWISAWLYGRPPANVWFGTTVEDQQRANERIPHLIAAPATVRFLSCEPLLGPVDLSKWMDEDLLGFVNSEIDWVIIGGESGAGARPFDLKWARSLVWQCRNGGRSVEPTPFVKQLGANVHGEWGPNAPTHHLTDVTVSPPRESIELDRFKNGRWRLRDRAGGNPAEWPADLRVREFPEVRRGA